MQHFDMDACLRERKESTPHAPFTGCKPLKAEIKIAGAPDSLSPFGTRVVLNEVLHGVSKTAAFEKALTLHKPKRS